MEMPRLESGRCNGCGLCIGVCRGSALVMIGGVAIIVETGECDWCAECEAVCPTRAISCPFEIVIEG
jgi:MinD superfamily P-loop ATPase